MPTAPEEMTLKVIAHIHTAFPTKFGIPRQSGLVDSLRGEVIFTPEYRSADAVRGEHDRIIGLICINLYLNTSLCDILDGLTPGTVQAMAARENFAADAKELIVSALEPVRARVMADDSILPSNKNKAIVEELDQKGMFRLKDSVVFVAEQLGISRNTIYMHLRNHRKRTENN